MPYQSGWPGQARPRRLKGGRPYYAQLVTPRTYHPRNIASCIGGTGKAFSGLATIESSVESLHLNRIFKLKPQLQVRVSPQLSLMTSAKPKSKSHAAKGEPDAKAQPAKREAESKAQSSKPRVAKPEPEMPQAHASGNPRHRARHHAGDVPRRARPDHRRHRAAHHRPAFRQYQRPVVGGDRLSAHRHGGDAALRQARRYPRPARADAHGHRHFRCRVGRLRAGAEHDRAGAGPRLPGSRRRRADGARANHHRRHCFPARARPLPGLYRRGVRDLLGGWTGARRLPHRAHRLVAHFLDQPAARPGCARYDLERAAPCAVSSAQTQARYHRRAADDVGGGRAAARAVLGRAELRMDLGADRRTVCSPRRFCGACLPGGWCRRRSRSYP